MEIDSDAARALVSRYGRYRQRAVTYRHRDP